MKQCQHNILEKNSLGSYYCKECLDVFKIKPDKTIDSFHIKRQDR